MLALVVVLMGALLPLQCLAKENYPGSCVVGLGIDNSALKIQENLAKLTALGEIAIVASELNPDAENLKCIYLTMNMAENNYTVKFKHTNGTQVKLAGPLQANDIINIRLATTTYLQMTNWNATDYPDVLGKGKLYPVYLDDNMVVLKTCDDGFLVHDSYTFVGVPLVKAQENTACNCNWTSNVPAP